MRRFTLVLCAAAVVAPAVVLPIVLAGSTIGVDTGPLGGGPVHAAICGPGPTVAIGIDELENSTGSPIRIERFSLVDARGLKLLGVDLVPLGHGPGLGAVSPYPPSRSTLAGWGSRQALPMTLPPDHTHWSLVYGLQRTAKTGTLSYPELLYEYRGAQYLWTSPVAIKVVSGGACLH